MIRTDAQLETFHRDGIAVLPELFSPPNLSPHDRRIFSLILNPVGNARTREQRPDYKHHRDPTPVAMEAGPIAG